ncbi:MAG: hypothetical protein EZS28_009362 [Streblomastix strix]|uniref:Malonyl-CoA:ACP transacylase (MAT) domain-containing protein n=1 Tax=Streblomastix strix TaxID=222440 RepID=A0A5J4WJJ3_9EUKA|nr:MAG: hypothetical protein EZS28_009362 [Streblomastix strix]
MMIYVLLSIQQLLQSIALFFQANYTKNYLLINIQKCERSVIIVISGRSAEPLKLNFRRLVDYLEQQSFIQLENIVYKLVCHRTALDQTRFAYFAKQEIAIEYLHQVASSNSTTEGGIKSSQVGQSEVSNTYHYIRTIQSERKNVIIIVSSRQGPQWRGMGCSLYKTNTIFRESINKISELFYLIDPSLNIINDMFSEKNKSKMRETFVLQPIFFATQVSLFEVMKSAQIINSLCEFATSYCSGALSLANAVLVCYTRSRMQYSIIGKVFITAMKLDITKLQAGLKQNNDLLQKEKEKNTSGKLTITKQIDFGTQFTIYIQNIW